MRFVQPMPDHILSFHFSTVSQLMAVFLSGSNFSELFLPEILRVSLLISSDTPNFQAMIANFIADVLRNLRLILHFLLVVMTNKNFFLCVCLVLKQINKRMFFFHPKIRFKKTRKRGSKVTSVLMDAWRI